MSALIYLAAVMFAVVAMVCVIEIALEGYQYPEGTLWPDGEPDYLDESPWADKIEAARQELERQLSAPAPQEAEAVRLLAFRARQDEEKRYLDQLTTQQREFHEKFLKYCVLDPTPPQMVLLPPREATDLNADARKVRKPAPPIPRSDGEIAQRIKGIQEAHRAH